MARKDKAGNWYDHKGRAIPPGSIDKVVKKRDAAVTRGVAKLLKLQQQMVKAKADLIALKDEFLAYEASVYGGRPEDWKGNLTLTDFAQDARITFACNENFAFDERRAIVVATVKAIVARWAADGLNENLRVMIEADVAFDGGAVPVKTLLRWRGYKIKDRDWQAAMAILDEAFHLVGTKEYIYAEVRPAPGGKLKKIKLAFNDLEV